ncbi:MAG TPA: hypothetical protein H9887_08305 [Candidatus Dorea intestinavium]|nr:hypothetical protein [Candidatus Dorea intestinavium]
MVEIKRKIGYHKRTNLTIPYQYNPNKQMNKKTYDVLRFVEHDDTCHISSDTIEGEVLINYLKFHPHIEAETLFKWIDSLREALRLFHKSRKQAYYYVSPFSVIVSTTDLIFLADLESKENRNICQKMERKTIKEMFFPNQTESTELLGDYYSLGKTILYMVSSTSLCTGMKYQEKRKIKKLTKKLMKNKEIKEYQLDQRKLAILSVFILLFGIIIHSLLPEKRATNLQKVVEAREIQDHLEVDEEKMAMQFHLGMLYLVSLENYEKAREIFVSLFEEWEVAAHLADVAAFIGGKFDPPKEAMLESLDYILEYYPQEEEIDPTGILIRAYQLLDMEEANERIISIITSMSDGGKIEITDYNLLSAYATALEKNERWADSAKVYEEILKEEGREEEEELYLMLIALYERLEEPGKIYEVIEKAINKKPKAISFRIAHLRTLLKDENIEVEKIKQTLTKYQEELPQMMETEEYKLLALEYKIEEKEGELWMER